MKMRNFFTGTLLGLACYASAVPLVSRDMVMELANEHLMLRWYCDSSNIYSGVTNATCPYHSAGWQTGLAYKWGGYDTRDSFYTNVVVNHGRAGDTNSAAIVSGTYGNDCSGFVSRLLRSGHYTTSSYPGISTLIDYSHMAPGDVMNLAGSHMRMFDKYTGTNLIQEFECTTGVSPGRVTRRILSRNDDYEPRRYNSFVAWPSIVRVQANSASSALIEWQGAATTGFRVYQSTDASNWSQVASEGTLGPLAQSITVSGLAEDTTYYFTVRCVNGTAPTDASCIFPVRLSSTGRKALIVNGFDRWINKTESGGKPHTFLPRYAEALAGANYAFDTVDNLRVLDQSVALGSYSSVWWMLGDESTADEALSYQEELRLQDYLSAGGKLFITGAELLWDIGHSAGPINDAAFMTNYLKASYSADGSSGNGYAFSGVASTPFSALSGAFDNGSGGTFNVLYPDELTPTGGSIPVLRYSSGAVAATFCSGTFGTGTSSGAVFVSGIPFETITSAAARQSLVNAATTAFFAGSSVDQWSKY
jgi:hypothetical protein